LAGKGQRKETVSLDHEAGPDPLRPRYLHEQKDPAFALSIQAALRRSCSASTVFVSGEKEV
jgi:hypothetical protein